MNTLLTASAETKMLTLCPTFRSASHKKESQPGRKEIHWITWNPIRFVQFRCFLPCGFEFLFHRLRTLPVNFYGDRTLSTLLSVHLFCIYLDSFCFSILSAPLFSFRCNSSVWIKNIHLISYTVNWSLYTKYLLLNIRYS